MAKTIDKEELRKQRNRQKQKEKRLELKEIEKAKKAMVPPFEISIFADPAGSFTTAAAMIACVKNLLLNKFQTDFKNKKLQIYF